MVPAAAASESAALLAQITASLRTDSRVLCTRSTPTSGKRSPPMRSANSLEQRVAASAAARWLLAPDAALFNTVGEADKTVLAKELLQSRAGVAPHQGIRAEARTKLITRTADLMDSIKDDRDTWRETAQIGRWAFIGTLAIAALAIVYGWSGRLTTWTHGVFRRSSSRSPSSPRRRRIVPARTPAAGHRHVDAERRVEGEGREGEAEADETEEDAKDKPEPKQPSTKVAAKPKGRARGTPR
jgi:hypothetical protein